MRLMHFRILPLLSCIALTAANLTAQSVAASAPRDTIPICRETGLPFNVYQSLLRRQFASIANPQGNVVVGNFASLDTKDGEITFAGSGVVADRSILGVKAHGAGSDGILNLVSESRISKKVGADLQLSVLGLRGDSLVYDVTQLDTYCEGEKKIWIEFANRQVEVDSGYRQRTINAEIFGIGEQIKKLDEEKNKPIKDTLAFVIKRLERRRDSLRADSARLSKDAALQRSRDNVAIRRARARSLDSLANAVKLRGFSLGWWSFGYSIGNNTFRRFDSTVTTFADQVTKASYTSHALSLAYSYYQLSPVPFETSFWSVRLKGGISDNFGTLTKKEITETVEYGAAPGDRTIESKYDAYLGAFETGLKTAALDFDFYQFLMPGNTFAVHVYPNVTVKERSDPVTNVGIGLLMSAKAKDDAFVNAELYFNFVDLGNSANSKLNLGERGNLGMRFTFPITFKPGL